MSSSTPTAVAPSPSKSGRLRKLPEPWPGKLIVVEGIDGSGKSTQLDLLRKWLISKGYCVYHSEWNSSPLVREITKRAKEGRLLSPISFSLIHAADFADRLERSIVPALKAGAVVLADRFCYTAFARDVVRGVSPEYVRHLYAIAPEPTEKFYFQVPLEEALRRILSGRAELNYYEAGMDLRLSEDIFTSFRIFQGRLLDTYSQIVKEHDLTVVDATLPLTKQQQIIRRAVEPHLEGVLRAPPAVLREIFREEAVAGLYLRELLDRQRKG